MNPVLVKNITPHGPLEMLSLEDRQRYPIRNAIGSFFKSCHHAIMGG